MGMAGDIGLLEKVTREFFGENRRGSVLDGTRDETREANLGSSWLAKGD